jgi:hypothetical protein
MPKIKYAGGEQLDGDLIFATDGVSDIGKSGATRPRDGFFSRNLNAGGAITAAGGALNQTTAPTSATTVDSSTATLSLANNATATLAAGFAYGLLYVADGFTTGNGALFLITNGANVDIILQHGTLFSTVATTASKINVYFSGGAPTIENKTGALISVVRVIALKA